MTQQDRVRVLLDMIADEVEDFFAEFRRPARSPIILRGYRSRIVKAGLDWHSVEVELKKKGLIRVCRHEQTNNKWYFPPLPDYPDEMLTEMVSLMDN